MIRYLTVLIFLLASGCGGGSSGSSAPSPLGPGSFWAVDFTSSSYYVVNATKAGEGNNCYIYVEDGRSVSQATIDNIILQFDSTIHPDENTAFGAEPDPGIDGDTKVYILLLVIRDGFTSGNPSFIAGYFDPMSEYALSSQNTHSNQKEILFMNINPAAKINPDGTEFFATIAHEFQHMIHWEQKVHQRGLTEATWIDESMAQVARTYCGYGPDYLSVFAYEHDLARNVNHSLVNFDETVGNYGMAYMWAQFMKDQFNSVSLAASGNHSLYWNMLHNSGTGITEVNDALAAITAARTFTTSFEDWGFANYFGNGATIAVPPNNQSRLYTTIDTWGLHNGTSLPGITFSQNQTTLQQLNQWSVGYYSYTPAAGSTTGTVTWTRNAANTIAGFIDGDTSAASVIPSMTPGTGYPFNSIGYLIYENPSSTSYLPAGSPVDTVAHTAVRPTGVLPTAVSASSAAGTAPARTATPRELLSRMNADPTVGSLVRQRDGRPIGIYADSWFREREKELRTGGARPPF